MIDESQFIFGNIYKDGWDNKLEYKLISFDSKLPNEVVIEITNHNDPKMIGMKINWAKRTFMAYAIVIPQQQSSIAIGEPPTKPKPHNCECGAYKAGYTKPGRAHAHSYCPMYKE